jgi:Pectate lyase superfamily protein
MPRYPYRDLGTGLGRDFRNNLNANFDDIEADLRDIQNDLDSKESRITQIENDSIERDNDLDARIDNLVLSAGDSSPEVADARYDSRTNTTYTTLKDRLDSHSNEIGNLLKSKFTVANVVEYGAKGDGVTDDRQAFLNALNYLRTKGGGILFIPPTTAKYVISNQIEWDETYGHIIVMGVGRASHVYLAQKSTNGHLFGAIGSGTDEENWIPAVTFKDIQVSTYDGTPTQDDNPIGVSKAKNILFENVYVSFSNWKGITVQGYAKNVIFKNCEVANCKKYGLGVELSTVTDIQVINCTTHDNGEQGAYFTNAGDGGWLNGLKINGLITYNNGLEGFGVSGADGGEAINVRSYRNRGEGIKLYNTKNFYVKGESKENDLAGARTILGSRNIFEVDSRNNSLNDPSERGNFFIESTPNTKLVNCIGNEGVRAFTNWSENVDFENCYFEGTTKTSLSTTLALETAGRTFNHLGNRITYGDAAPIAGTFKRGDIRQIVNVSAGGVQGYICTSSGKAHKPSTGTLTAGSNQITNVTNVDTWAVGDRIQGGGIPFGTTITAIDGTTITMSTNATSGGTQSLYDAIFKPFGTIST